MQKWFIMLVGIPASGKSSFVETFQKTAGKNYCRVISSDFYIDKWAREQGTTYSEIFKSVVGEAEKCLWQDYEEAISEGIPNVIWDQTNLTAKSRRAKLNKVPDNYKKLAVFFEPPEESLHKRLLDGREGKFIPYSVISDMRNRLEYPEIAEGFSCIFYRKIVELEGRIEQRHSTFKWSE